MRLVCLLHLELSLFSATVEKIEFIDFARLGVELFLYFFVGIVVDEEHLVVSAIVFDVECKVSILIDHP
jgi:hypothetical protein